MNTIKFLLISSLLFILSNCIGHSEMTKLPNGKLIDPSLVGVWTGSEKNHQFEGTEKKWTMTRSKDGTFSIIFNIKNDNGEESSFTETGNWWIKNGKFYEYHDYSQKTDVYSYKLINKNQVKFKSEHLSITQNIPTYEFIDTRISSEPQKNK